MAVAPSTVKDNIQRNHEAIKKDTIICRSTTTAFHYEKPEGTERDAEAV